MPGCSTSDIAALKEYSKWVDDNLWLLSEYVAKNTSSNEYCTDAAAPQVGFSGGVSKPVVENVQVALDPVKELHELTKIVQKKQLAECRFLTKQFLAKMKEHGCSGTSCRVKGRRLCGGGKTTTTVRARRSGGGGGGCAGGMCTRP